MMRRLGLSIGFVVLLGCAGLTPIPKRTSDFEFESVRPADGSSYVGEIVDGLYHGSGRLTWPSGAEYVGNFRHGLKSGSGKMVRRSGETHEGQYAFGERHGDGRLLTAGGNVYLGEFKNGETRGRGTWKFLTGADYQGEVANGELRESLPTRAIRPDFGPVVSTCTIDDETKEAGIPGR